MICTFQVFLVPGCFKFLLDYLTFCMGVSAVDFIVHLPSNRCFFRQNCCILRIVLLGNTAGEFSTTTIAEDGNEKISKPLKKENFFAQQTLSNLNSNAIINNSISTIITLSTVIVVTSILWEMSIQKLTTVYILGN